MRAFIAIELPKEIKDELAKLQERLKAAGADAKWVAADNLHLTLKFLGEINDKQLEEITSIIEETAKNHSPFQLRINSMGVFPKIGFPRVIWVGADPGGRETERIAAELEEKIARCGIPEEKRGFSSHITIARVRSPLNRDKLIRELNKLEGYFREKNLQLRAAKITLFKSTLTQKGPVYEIQKETILSAS